MKKSHVEADENHHLTTCFFGKIVIFYHKNQNLEHTASDMVKLHGDFQGMQIVMTFTLSRLFEFSSLHPDEQNREENSCC